MIDQTDLDRTTPNVDYSPITLPEGKTYQDLQKAHGDVEEATHVGSENTAAEDELYPKDIVHEDVTRAFVREFDQATSNKEVALTSDKSREVTEATGLTNKEKIAKARDLAFKQIRAIDTLDNDDASPADRDNAMNTAIEAIDSPGSSSRSTFLIETATSQVLESENITKTQEIFLNDLLGQTGYTTSDGLRRISIETIKKIAGGETTQPIAKVLESISKLTRLKSDDLGRDGYQILIKYLNQDFPPDSTPSSERVFIIDSKNIAINAARSAILAKEPSAFQIELAQAAVDRLSDGDFGMITKFIDDMLLLPQNLNNPQIEKFRRDAFSKIAKSEKTFPEERLMALKWIVEYHGKNPTANETEIFLSYLDPIPQSFDGLDKTKHNIAKKAVIRVIDDAINAGDPSEAQRHLGGEAISKITDGSSDPQVAQELFLKIIQAHREERNRSSVAFTRESIRRIAEGELTDEGVKISAITELCYLKQKDLNQVDVDILKKYLDVEVPASPYFAIKIKAIEAARRVSSSESPSSAQISLLEAVAKKVIEGDAFVTDLTLRDYIMMAESKNRELRAVATGIFRAWTDGKTSNAEISKLGVEKIAQLAYPV